MNRNKTSDSPQTAVALHYDGLTTPRVTASGQGLTGEQIIQLAIDNDVPLHEDAGLATALSCIPIGEEIPRELYLAVAEVLAFVYFLDEVQHSYGP
jgi:flagellar biosynthesis protein